MEEELIVGFMRKNQLPDEKDEFNNFLERFQEWFEELVQKPQSYDCFFTTFCREISEVPSVPSYFSH